MAPRSPSASGIRVVCIWTAVVLVLLYAGCGYSIATMSASAELGELLPYIVAGLGTVVVVLAMAFAILVTSLALREPEQYRSPSVLATAVVIGTYVVAAAVVVGVWSVGGLLTDTGVTDATWVTYLTASVVVLVVLISLATWVIRRPARARRLGV
jgi:hypothetical protein